MYINSIDVLIDNIINDFSNLIIFKKNSKYNELFNKILSKNNFLKYQKEINELLELYISKIKKIDISNIVSNTKSINVLMNIIKKYLLYYIFLTINFHSNNKDEFINQLLQFNSNQKNFSLKVIDFFNSDSNSKIIKLSNLIKNSLYIIDLDKNEALKLYKKNKYEDEFSFLNSIGKEIIDSQFKLENLKNNKSKQCHNIVNAVIIENIYKKTEKSNIFNILYSEEKESGNFRYIDIVVSKENNINIDEIENILDNSEINSGLGEDLFNLLEKSNKFNPLIKINSKIKTLLENKMIIPVTKDLLLYHSNSEKYDNNKNDKDKNDTKIKYIVNKIDNSTELFSKLSNKKKIERLFYLPLSNKKAILINEIENINIINKLEKLNKNILKKEFYKDLVEYRKYPYISFKDNSDNEINIEINKTIDAVRSISLKKKY